MLRLGTILYQKHLVRTKLALIKCGSVVIPFDNQISKDTDLYKLYNTNIHEIIEMKKHANEKC